MKTIRVKKENFDIDGLCSKITDAIYDDILRAEGIVSSAIMDYFYNPNVEEYLDEDELDYDTAIEELYEGNMKLALLFGTIGSEDNYVACANGKEYKIKDEEDDYEPFPYGCIDEDDEDLYDYDEEEESSLEEDEIESLDVGVLTVYEETANVLYLDCYEDYIYISTAHYGSDCIGCATVLIEENWGELDDIVLDFIKPFIKNGEYETKRRPYFKTLEFYTHDMYVFDKSKLILTDSYIHKIEKNERGLKLEKIISEIKGYEREFISKEIDKLGRKLNYREEMQRRNDSEIDSISEILKEEPSIVTKYITKIKEEDSKENRPDLLKEIKKQHNPLKDYLDKGYIRKSIKDIKKELNIN